MEKEVVQDTGLTQDKGSQSPETAPGKQGEDTVPAAELRKLYKELRKWKDKYRELQAHKLQIEERGKELEKLKMRLSDAHITAVLTEAAAAQDAINPHQIAQFLRERVALSEDLKPAVNTAEEGSQASSAPLSVEELVADFLSRYPYHRKAKLSGGSGSVSSPAALKDTLKDQIKSASSQRELEKIISTKRNR